MRTRAPLTALSLVLVFSVASAQIEHPKTYDLTNIKWRLSFDEAKREIFGDVVNTVKPLNATSKVVFDAGKLQIESTAVNGTAAQFENDGKTLTVDLPMAAAKGQKLDIEIRYSAYPQAGVYFVPPKRAYPGHTSVVYTQGEMIDTRYWMPTYDWPDNKATFEAFITVPKGCYALSNGALLGVEHQGDKDVYHWKLDQPQSTYLLSFCAGKFDETEDHDMPAGALGVPPTYFYTPQGLRDWGQEAFGGTSKIINFYSRITGFPYPYPKFAQIAVPDYMFGGMENTTCVTQTIDALHPKNVSPLEDQTELVAHELAHQWFGDTVTCVDWGQTWLNEGFATFMPPLWMREKDGQDAFDLARLDIFRGGYYSQAAERRAVVWNKYKEPFDVFTGVVYPGGASRLYMLMYKLGEPAFWKGIHDYLEAYKYKNVDTSEFFSAMSKSSGVNLDAFKQQWLYNIQVPSLKVSRDGTALVVKQPADGFDFPVDIWIWNGTAWVKKSLEINSNENRLDLGELAGKPLLVDPEVHVMAPVSYDMGYTAEDWATLFWHAPNAAQKVIVFQSGLSKFSGAQLVSMAQAMLDHPFLQARLIEMLRDSAKDYVMAQSKSEDARIRQAAVKALSRMSGNDVVARLRELFESDSNDLIKDEAFEGLLRLAPSDKLAEEGFSKVRTFDCGTQISALNYWVDAAPDLARDTALQIVNASAQARDDVSQVTPEPLRIAAINALGKLKDKSGETAVYDALVRVTRESSFNARTAAINALADYGNPNAIQILTPLTSNSMFFIRGSAESAIGRLQNH